MALAVVADLRQARTPASAEQIAAFETDVLAAQVEDGANAASSATADGGAPRLSQP